MKKGRIIGIAVLVIIVLFGAGVWYSGAVFGIDQKDAEEIAKNQVSGIDQSAQIMTNTDYDDLQKIYEVKISQNGAIYDFEISARGGKILSSEVEQVGQPQNQNQSQEQNQNQGNDIGLEKAKAIALEQVPGASETDIVSTDMDNERASVVYEVEIHFDGMEYDFSIDSVTGEIVENSSEHI